MNYLLLFYKNKILKHYLYFNGLIVLASGILLSVIAFFHFLLGHELAVIENWANLHYWEFLILMKFGLLYFYKKWFELNYFKKYNLIEFFKTWTWTYNYKIVVLIVFLNFMFHFLLNDYLDFSLSGIGFYNIFITGIGIISLFFVDYFFIQWLFKIFPNETKIQPLYLGLYLTSIFSLGVHLYLPHLQEKIFLFSLVYLALWLHSFLWAKSSLDIILYILGICVPLSLVWGFDPVWGDEYSIFKLSKQPSYFLISVWWLLGIMYSSGKFNKYIQRLID